MFIGLKDKINEAKVQKSIQTTKIIKYFIIEELIVN